MIDPQTALIYTMVLAAAADQDGEEQHENYR